MSGGDDDRLDRLEERMARLEDRLARIEAALPGPPADEATEPEPEDAQVEPLDPPSPTPDAEATETPATFQPAEGQGPGDTAPTQARPRSLEERIGGDWLAKAGMVVLVLGVAFFLKYAFDNDWIGLTGRIVLGVVGGLALVATGDLLHQRKGYGVYPQVLAGGGSAIVYFSLYAAYAFPEYRAATGISQGLDSVLLGATALALAGYATWRSMPTLAGLAVVLGAITALVAETFDAFSVFYLVLLAAVISAAAAYRGWAHVTLAVLVASHVTLGIDLALDVDPTLIMWGSVLLLVLFVAAGLRTSRQEAQRLGPALAGGVALLGIWGTLSGAFETFTVVYPVLLAAGLVALAAYHELPGSLIAGTVAAYAMLAVGLTPPAEVLTDAVLWSSVIVLGLSVASAWLVHEERGSVGGLTATSATAALAFLATWGLILLGLTLEDATAWRGPATLALAVASIGLALVPQAPLQSRAGWSVAGAITLLAWPPIQFDGTATAVAWAGLLLVAAGARYRWALTPLRAGVFAAAGLLVAHLLVDEAVRLEQGEMAQVLGLLVFLAATAAMTVAWWTEGRSHGQHRLQTRLLLSAAVLLPVVYVGTALDGFTVPIWWAIGGLALVATGFAADLSDVRTASLAVFTLVLARVFIVDMAELDVVVRIITFLVVGAVLLGASFLYARAQRRETPPEAR